MIEDGPCTEAIHQPVEGQGRITLEERVAAAAVAHAVNNLEALAVVAHHLRDDTDVVLKVGIDGHDAVGLTGGGLHAGHQRVLVSAVPA